MRRITSNYTLQIILSPIVLLYERARGFNIIHLHWVHVFHPRWAKAPIFRSFFYAWMKLWFFTARCLGFKILWTSHNYLPHDKTFPDDLKAREWLVAHVDEVVSVTDGLADQISSTFGFEAPKVIPLGRTVLAVPGDRKEVRRSLGISETSIVVALLGYLKQYKGVETLLAAGLQVESGYSFIVAGECDDPEYQATLEQLASRFEGSEQRLVFRSGFLSDQTFSDYLGASDYVCIPFVAISNSGSIESALTAGKPVVVPDIPSLEWIPINASVKFPCGATPSNLAAALVGLPPVDSAEYRSMSKGALEWSQSVSWPSVAAEYAKVYREMMSND
jgi:glycosyltransferase involved in cell wall biosynthesis